MTEILNVLHSFGITRCYKGFKHTAFAIYLAVQDKSRLEAVTNWTAVERNIRTTVARAWKVNCPLLSEMAGYPLACVPTASEFIEILASYILRSSVPQSQLWPLSMR